jgi:rod shape determining protein RodA
MSVGRLEPVAGHGRWPAARSAQAASKSMARRAFARDSLLRRLDWTLLLTVLALSVIGSLLVWSSSPKSYLVKQAINITIGLILMFVVSATDYRRMRLFAPVLYGVSLLGLLAVLTPLGKAINGSKGWIILPAGFEIEPSEYVKLALIGVSAILLSEVRQSETRPRLRAVALVVGLAAIPLALIVKEPDLGVTVLLLVLVVLMIALSGIKLRWLFLLVGGGTLGVYGVLHLHLLKAYQLSRLTSFLHPTANLQSTGYNAAQAKLAIGSGGLLGQGLFHGQLIGGNYVPEQNTDFIFAVAGEELGFVGAVVIIALMALLLLRALRIAARADDQFGMLVAAGIAIWFAVQTFINIGMTVGIMPVVGLPLPFVSYGGSAMFADMIAMGALQAVHQHHRVFS